MKNSQTAWRGVLFALGTAVLNTPTAFALPSFAKVCGPDKLGKAKTGAVVPARQRVRC